MAATLLRLSSRRSNYCRNGFVNLMADVEKRNLSTSCTASYWNKDFKPGPYPRTPEERAAAAKKYGLLPEDYEPYPDDGFGYGDYPKLPAVSADGRDPYYNWDIPELRRNFGEPIHVQADMYGENRYNISAKPPISRNKMALVFASMLAISFGLFHLFENFKIHHTLMPKQYPKPGVKHYTFEPADS